MESTHFKKLLCSAFMLVFLVGCGKDNSSGGSKSGGSSTSNPVVVGDVAHDILTPSLRNTQAGTRILGIFNQALAWRNSTQEGQVLSAGFTRGFIQPNANTSENCKQKEFWFFDFELCSYSSSGQSQQLQFSEKPLQVCIEGQGSSLRTKSIVSETVPYSYGCELGGSWVNYSKSSNTELTKIMSLNNKNWSLHNAQFSNGIYTIVVGPLNAAPSLTYVIDTRYHSVYNPVLIYNQQTQKSMTTITQ